MVHSCHVSFCMRGVPCSVICSEFGLSALVLSYFYFLFFGKKSVECVQSHLLCACAPCRQFNARLRKTDQTERLLDESCHFP